MEVLFNSKLYHWSLFIGHLSIEKYLKAIYVNKFSKHPPFTHNLYKLAVICELEFNDDISDKLDFISTFNIEARYDDYKKDFYKKCTIEFAEIWISNIKDIIRWLKMIF